jgi:hypothetical protein
MGFAINTMYPQISRIIPSVAILAIFRYESVKKRFTASKIATGTNITNNPPVVPLIEKKRRVIDPIISGIVKRLATLLTGHFLFKGSFEILLISFISKCLAESLGGTDKSTASGENGA